jgi:hypothetical protein
MLPALLSKPLPLFKRASPDLCNAESPVSINTLPVLSLLLAAVEMSMETP